MTIAASVRTLFDGFLSQHVRLLELATALPDAALMVERFHGREAVSELFRFEIDCVSTNAFFELKSLIGEEVTLRVLLADGDKRAWHGYVTEAMQLGADGGLARYRLIMEPWLAFLGKRYDNRVYQDMDAVAVLGTIFAQYHEADWSHDISQNLRRHSRLTQYRETQLDFVRRILADEGLAFRFEHDQNAVAGDDVLHARHRLAVYDRHAVVPDMAQSSVRFHRADATEADDTIQAFREARQVLPNRARLAGWDYKTLIATSAEADTTLDNGQLPSLEVYDGSRAYCFESGDAARLRTDLLLAAYESGYRRFFGEGSARTLAEGHVFTLRQHEDYDGQRFVALAVEHHGANNLGTQAAHLLDASGIEPGTYRNRFIAQTADTPMVPLPRSRPVAGAQSALVVGLPDATLTTERDHRVKVQFHWQRGEAPNPGGLMREANAPGNDRSGTWVRVAEWQAGPNWGGQFLPRIGTEVLVDFMAGDIDRPVVVGQIHNGQDLPPFSAGQDSGANHPGTISGWMSHNHEDGHNQWLADDAQGQVRTRLSSSAAASELGMGHLIHQAPDSATRGAWRGAGFELRSDGWVAVRAGEGMLISATARANAQSTQMDVAETVGQLKAAEETAKALSDAATAQAAMALEANPAQSAFVDAIDPAKQGKFSGAVGGQPAKKAQPGSRELGDPTERFDQPFIVSEAPGDIGIASPASTLLFAGRHLHATAQGDLQANAAYTLSAAVGEGASWFSHAGGIKAIAAAGTHTIQAHTDAMQVIADKSVTVTSSNGEIHILANSKVVLLAGQSSVTLNGGDVTFTCPGTFSVKGSGNAFVGPAGAPAGLGSLPVGTAVVPPKTPLQTVYSQRVDATALNHADWQLEDMNGFTQINAYQADRPLGRFSNEGDDARTFVFADKSSPADALQTQGIGWSVESSLEDDT